MKIDRFTSPKIWEVFFIYPPSSTWKPMDFSTNFHQIPGHRGACCACSQAGRSRGALESCLGKLSSWKGVTFGAVTKGIHGWLGGGFKHFIFSPLPGEMIQFDKYFSNGLKPPTSWGWYQHLMITLPETTSSHLKIDGWKISFPFGFLPIFRGYVGFRGCKWLDNYQSTKRGRWGANSEQIYSGLKKSLI